MPVEIAGRRRSVRRWTTVTPATTRTRCTGSRSCSGRSTASSTSSAPGSSARPVPCTSSGAASTSRSPASPAARAPLFPRGAPHCGPHVMQEAYSHEVSSCGYWPDGGTEGLFYSYAYPEPDGFQDAPMSPGASYDEELGEFVLPYELVRASQRSGCVRCSSSSSCRTKRQRTAAAGTAASSNGRRACCWTVLLRRRQRSLEPGLRAGTGEDEAQIPCSPRCSAVWKFVP